MADGDASAFHPGCVYYAHMARVNVYLSDELHERVKAERIPISEICQRALVAELERIRRESTARQTVLWADQPTNRRQQ